MLPGHTYVKKLTEEQKVESCRLYAEGWSCQKIAERYGVDRTSIHSILHNRGVKMRTLRESNRRDPFNEAAFDVVTEESAYWAGFLMADGSVTDRKYSMYVKLGLQGGDIAHIERFAAFLGTSNKIGFTKKPQGFSSQAGFASVSVASNHLAASLARFGITPRKSAREKVLLLENDRHFWRGMVDGDGFVMGDYKRPSIGLVGSLAITSQFIDFARTVVHTPAQPRRMHSIWAVRLGSSPAISLMRHLYESCTVALDRKQTLALSLIRENEQWKRDRAAAKVCTIEGCGGEVEAKGLCLKHYKRVRKHGDHRAVATRWSGPDLTSG